MYLFKCVIFFNSYLEHFYKYFTKYLNLRLYPNTFYTLIDVGTYKYHRYITHPLTKTKKDFVRTSQTKGYNSSQHYTTVEPEDK